MLLFINSHWCIVYCVGNWKEFQASSFVFIKVWQKITWKGTTCVLWCYNVMDFHCWLQQFFSLSVSMRYTSSSRGTRSELSFNKKVLLLHFKHSYTRSSKVIMSPFIHVVDQQHDTVQCCNITKQITSLLAFQFCYRGFQVGWPWLPSACAWITNKI